MSNTYTEGSSSAVMRVFRCSNCGTSISMNVQPGRIMKVDGQNILANTRCWCDNEHGILIQASNR